MYDNETRGKLQNIVSGTIIEGQTDNCTAARNHLCKSFSTSTNVKRDFESRSKIKEEQSKLLKKNSLLWIGWYKNLLL
jgi:hypothetical protein